MKIKPIIGGNWKMNKTVAESKTFIDELLKNTKNLQEKIDIVILPSYTCLNAVSNALKGRKIVVGAQNMYFEEKGAFTGEVSADMLIDAGATYVVLGHSERRKIFNESDDLISKKVKMAHIKGLKPIVCIGETLDERDAGQMEEILKTQINGSLSDLTEDQILGTVIAYEPVWAIGTGLTATPEQAQEAHIYIRQVLASIYGESIAQSVRIQYGGSIKPENAKELFAQLDINGGLVGGASLDVKSFIEIIKAALL